MAATLIKKNPYHQRNATDIFFLQHEKVRSKTPFEKKMENLSIEGRNNYTRNNKDSCLLGIDKVNYFKTSYKESQTEIEKERNKQRALTKPKNDDDKDKVILHYPKLNMHLKMKTTGGLFANQKNSRENRLELNKSNIFYDPEKDIMNKTFTITPDILKQEKIKTLNPIRFIKRRKIRNDDDQSNLFNSTKTALTARERKNANNNGHFPSQYNDYKPMEPPKELSSVDDIKKKEIIRKYEGITENQRKTEDFMVTGNKDMNIHDIQKVFHDNGLHIYNERDDTSYYDGQNKGKITFKIRSCEEDKTYATKIDAVKSYIKKNKGLSLKKVEASTKEYF